MIVWGMWVQAVGLFVTAGSREFGWWLLGSILLGIGTAMVYPTLIAAISDASHPTRRARSLSVYRFWRDSGYAIGALIASVIGDLFGLAWAIAAVGMLTFISGVIVARAMKENRELTKRHHSQRVEQCRLTSIPELTWIVTGLLRPAFMNSLR
jgi:MFS family permease